MNTFLDVKNLDFSYHTADVETNALNNISFQLPEGEFLAIIGPSGCGKSTLLSLIAGILKPEAGSITFRFPDSIDYTSLIGYMLQRDQLLEWRSIYDNVILGLEINHMLTNERMNYVKKLLDNYGLASFTQKHPSELSGGMRQRAALIRTLAMEPQLLLLDEPFSALDYQTRLTVSEDICKLIRDAGKTMIIVTHDLSEAISLADRILVLSGRPATVKNDISIHLTRQDSSPLAARNAPEFNGYFNQLWSDLQYEY